MSPSPASKLALLLLSSSLGAAQAQDLVATPAPAACAASVASASEATEQEIQPLKTNYLSFLNEPGPRLKSETPLLHTLRFEEHPILPGNQIDQSSDPLAEILHRTGAKIMETASRVPNLIATEEFAQAHQKLASYTSFALLNTMIHAGLAPTVHHAVFNYRIQSTGSSTSGTLWNEYRTDEHNQPVPEQNISRGFANTQILFAPGNLDESSFRYLGRQRLSQQSAERETYVVAFAQTPGRVRVPPELANAQISCTYLIQGVAWIDATSYRIARIETDLLAPLPKILMKRLRTEVDFAEVTIPGRSLKLWMPRQVAIHYEKSFDMRFERQNLEGGEFHWYSDYRLFAATSRLIVPKSEP